ncbi:hypothetical protein AXX17_AT3G36980 [Arabidopsis thaliana]|uniref:Transmembrane protein n=1 Tax=Arabidopsis thaliana TaxID=3702 RepID=A0A178V608_ARATH|nr:hypothetical protein AXX17_AT3G36980 [Arabidopsis thaliana]
MVVSPADDGCSGDNGNPDNGVVAPVMAFVPVRVVAPATVVVVMMAATAVVVVMTTAAVVVVVVEMVVMHMVGYM